MNGNQENLSPQIVRQIFKEYATFKKDPIEGVQVKINEEDVSEIHAVIEGPPSTPYAGGSFKMKLCLTRQFPSTPPKGYFLTKIFHPNVSDTGEICVNVLKKDWNAKMGIRNVLLTVKCLLIHPNPESALNEEAGRLLLNQYDDYAARARLMTEIHAMSSKKISPVSSDDIPTSSEGICDNEPAMKKKATAKVAVEKKKKDKKKGLKRL